MFSDWLERIQDLEKENKELKEQIKIALSGFNFFIEDYDSGYDNINEDIASCAKDFKEQIEEKDDDF